MRNPLETLPEAEIGEESFDEIWEKAIDRWGINSSKAAELKSKISGQNTDEDDWICERPTIPMDEPKPDSLAVTQRSSELMPKTPDDTPEIIINETQTDIKSELLFLLIEEAILRIRNFEFESVTVEPGKSHLTNAIAKTLGNICEAEDLLLMIAVDANKFTILKKGWIDYTGRVMDEKKGYVFHSLLKTYPNAVTIK